QSTPWYEAVLHRANFSRKPLQFQNGQGACHLSNRQATGAGYIVHMQRVNTQDVEYLRFCAAGRDNSLGNMLGLDAGIADAEFVEDVISRHYQLSPLLDQAIGFAAGRAENVARYSENFAALFGCYIRCDKRAAAL